MNNISRCSIFITKGHIGQHIPRPFLETKNVRALSEMMQAGALRASIPVAAPFPVTMHNPPGPLVQLMSQIAAPLAKPCPPHKGTSVTALARNHPEIFPREVVMNAAANDTFARTTIVERVCQPGCLYTTAVKAGGVHYMPRPSRRHYVPDATSKDFALLQARGNAPAAACLQSWHAVVENATGRPIMTLDLATVSVVVDVGRAIRLTRKEGHVAVDLFQGGQKTTAQAASDSAGHVLAAVAGLMGMSLEELNKHFSLPQGRVVYTVNGPPRAAGDKRKRDDEEPGLLRGQPNAGLTLARNPPCCKCNEPTRPARAFKPHPKDETKIVMCPACAKDPNGIVVGHLHYRPTRPQRLAASLHVAPRQPPLTETVGITIGLCCQRIHDAPVHVDRNTLHPLAALIVDNPAYFKHVAPMIGFSPDDMCRMRASTKTRIVWCNEHLTGDARKGFLKLCAQFKLRMVRYLPPCACAPLGFECPSVCWQVPLHGFVHELNKLIPNRPATPFGTPPTRESLMQRIAWCAEHLTGNAKTQFHSACEAYKTQTVKLTPVFFSCGRDLPRPPAFCAGVRGRSRVRAR